MKINRRAMFSRSAAAAVMLPAVVLGTREEPVALARGAVTDPETAGVTICGSGITLRDLYIEAPTGVRIEMDA